MLFSLLPGFFPKKGYPPRKILMSLKYAKSLKIQIKAKPVVRRGRKATGLKERDSRVA
jgi:hypothetical protein